MRTAAIIVAAGKGIRAGGGLPKQWREIAGHSVAEHTIAAFRRAPGIEKIVLVISTDDHGRAADWPGCQVVTGGADRAASVRAGLAVLNGTGVTHVLIHDIARPLVSQKIIADVLLALEQTDAAAPALTVTDALWRGEDGHVTGVQDRNGLYRAQTPQGFRLDAIIAAHQNQKGSAADDVEVARAAGVDVTIVAGDPDNIKITAPEDFARAEELLRKDMDIRVGNGFDVHAFEPGDQVVLCGIHIPFEKALKGHSDADVGMHALTDAIYGALAEGDIGRHFPPGDAKWKSADSGIFLEHAAALATSRGYRISNADVTLICEAPKIGPHATEMQETLAAIMGISSDRVSVKATTTERLGFPGRGEGIAALATATLVTA